jgi:hypothetical protein
LQDEDCVYTVYARTGSILKGGTDSIIGVKLYDEYGEYVDITNLEAWGGLMRPGHNYFERGNLDIFSGRAPCLAAPICAINLTSDGSGPHHGWYCNIHRAPHLLRPAALHGGAVARSRYVAVRAHGYPELLPLCGSESS